MSSSKSPENSAFSEKLNGYRAEIDAVDDRIIALLKERSAIVKRVGELKHAAAPGECPVRPGREAQQVRRVTEAFTGSDFEPAAAGAIWRMMIMASLALEGDIKVSVCATPSARDPFWLAREYFGPFTTMIRQPTPKRVLGDVLEGKAAIGVLPPFQGSMPELRWWTDIPSNGGRRPKVFACLPFVFKGKPTPDTPVAVAIGMVEPEPTGNDLSYLLIEVDEMVSQMKLQAAFAAEKLEARWIEVLGIVPGKRHHLVEVKGFIMPENESYRAVCVQLGGSVIATSFLGALAAPVVLE